MALVGIGVSLPVCLIKVPSPVDESAGGVTRLASDGMDIAVNVASFDCACVRHERYLWFGVERTLTATNKLSTDWQESRGGFGPPKS